MGSSLLGATEYHVKPSGSDAADGSVQHPFRTIGEPLPVRGGQLTIPVKAYAPVTLLLSSSPTGPE